MNKSESPYTGRKMTLVCNIDSKNRYYLCPDTNTLILTNVYTKFDIEEARQLKQKLLQGMKA
jgi:hypothetical protein